MYKEGEKPSARTSFVGTVKTSEQVESKWKAADLSFTFDVSSKSLFLSQVVSANTLISPLLHPPPPYEKTNIILPDFLFFWLVSPLADGMGFKPLHQVSRVVEHYKLLIN
ncbi:hypothetical protein CEXT_494991 [Caerostris extrusa]|uniref:Uncharacterized protein n=1 Tax=Caerostris extrusa TaxID=172846 RepID=A0AAV4M9L7_CAEEX|nr:hypothetical protein CEXT_494991 [Caerostris extrusa]